MKCLILIFLTAITLVGNVRGQTNKTNVQSTETTLVLPQQSTTQSNSFRAELLEQQLELIKGFDEKLYNTVLTALTLIGAIALVLVTYNWYSTSKLYQRDKASLKAEILGGFDEKQAAFERTISSMVNESWSRSEKRLSDLSTDLNDRLAKTTEKYATFSDQISQAFRETETKVANFNTATSAALSSYRKELEDQTRKTITLAIEDLQKHFKSQLASEIQQIKLAGEKNSTDLSDKIRTLKYSLLDVRYDVREDTAKDYEHKTEFSLAYTYYFKALESAVEAGKGWATFQKRSLENLVRVLKAGAKVTKSEIEAAESIASQVLPDFKILAAEFVSLVKSARVIGE